MSDAPLVSTSTPSAAFTMSTTASGSGQEPPLRRHARGRRPPRRRRRRSSTSTARHARARGRRGPAASRDRRWALPFPLRWWWAYGSPASTLTDGPHDLIVGFRSDPFGALELVVRDNVAAPPIAPRRHPPRPRRRLLPRDHRARASATSRSTRGTRLEHIKHYSFDPHIDPGQRRELHRRGAGADRAGRPAARPRRARRGRVPHPDGDRRGHARRVLQPRDEGAQRVGRRDLHGRRRLHAARAGVHLRVGARGARLQALDRRALRRDRRRAPKPPRASASCSTSTPTSRPSSRSCASTSRPATPRARTWSAAPRSRRARGSSSRSTPSAASTSSPTSRPTRRRRRSTS